MEGAVPNQVVPLQLQFNVIAPTELREQHFFFQLRYEVLGNACHERWKDWVLEKCGKLKIDFFAVRNLIAFKNNMQAKRIFLISFGYYSSMSKIGRPPKSKRSAFGERLQSLREQAKLTQREVAHQLGISQPSYVKWERRDIGITRDRLHQLAEILGVEVEDFFSIDDRPKRNGPVGRARTLFERVSHLPRSHQQRILGTVEDMLIAQKAKGSV